MVKPWIGIPTHFWFIPATTRCERRHVKPLPHMTHRCTRGLGGQIGGRHHREISSLGFSRMEITTGNSCWIKWARQFMGSELGWTPLCFNPAGHHKKRYMDVYLSIYCIWVNYSESLTWKVRLYCEDSPNPNHDSSEVTVRSLSFPQISLLSQIPWPVGGVPLRHCKRFQSMSYLWRNNLSKHKARVIRAIHKNSAACTRVFLDKGS